MVSSQPVITYLSSFPGTRLTEAFGDTFALYDPDRDLPPERQQPWATVVHSDVHDTFSDLGRPGVYRLNIGLPKARFAELAPGFGDDPTELDVLARHPVYGGLHWVCVLNPNTTMPLARTLLGEAHAFAVRKHRNAARRRGDT